MSGDNAAAHQHPHRQRPTCTSRGSGRSRGAPIICPQPAGTAQLQRAAPPGPPDAHLGQCGQRIRQLCGGRDDGLRGEDERQMLQLRHARAQRGGATDTRHCGSGGCIWQQQQGEQVLGRLLRQRSGGHPRRGRWGSGRPGGEALTPALGLLLCRHPALCVRTIPHRPYLLIKAEPEVQPSQRGQLVQDARRHRWLPVGRPSRQQDRLQGPSQRVWEPLMCRQSNASAARVPPSPFACVSFGIPSQRHMRTAAVSARDAPNPSPEASSAPPAA